MAETGSALKKETVINSSNHDVVDYLKIPTATEAVNYPKIARLLSTRYGKTCFDVIIAKTPEMACLHQVQLKFLQDQVRLLTTEIEKFEQTEKL